MYFKEGTRGNQMQSYSIKQGRLRKIVNSWLCKRYEWCRGQQRKPSWARHFGTSYNTKLVSISRSQVDTICPSLPQIENWRAELDWPTFLQYKTIWPPPVELKVKDNQLVHQCSAVPTHRFHDCARSAATVIIPIQILGLLISVSVLRCLTMKLSNRLSFVSDRIWAIVCASIKSSGCADRCSWRSTWEQNRLMLWSRTITAGVADSLHGHCYLLALFIFS
jgi:hypothetical protein